MNIKQKMAMAIWAVWSKKHASDYMPVSEMLDAALSVAADPENWTQEMRNAAYYAEDDFGSEFAAVINHIKGLPS